MFRKSKEKKKKEKRFIIKDQQNLGFGAVQVIVDTKSGINYLNTISAGMSGLTVLLDSEGKVIVDKEF